MSEDLQGGKLGIYDKATRQLKRTIDLVPNPVSDFPELVLAEPYTARADEVAYLWTPSSKALTPWHACHTPESTY